MCSAQGLSTGGWCGALPWLTHAIHVIFEIYIHFPGGSKGNLQGWAHLAHSLRGCCPHKHLRLAPMLFAMSAMSEAIETFLLIGASMEVESTPGRRSRRRDRERRGGR
eukprot:s5832_g6.t1